MDVPYDKKSAQSILNHAKKLTGKSLIEAVLIPEIEFNEINKGSIGTLVEKYYFEHTPPNTHDPDFPEAGVELKTTGLVIKRGQLRAKERLVLGMINYKELAHEDWESSIFLHKCRRMLIMFYEYDKNLPAQSRKFILDPILYELEGSDLQIIKRDWEFIKQKVQSGKAHELSEGDTFYLAACRKGSGGDKEPLRETPGDGPSAKSRAFSLKPSFVNYLMDKSADESAHSDYFNILDTTGFDSIETAIEKTLSLYVGRTFEDLISIFDLKKPSKNINRTLVNRMLSNSDSPISEIEKSGIEIKTVQREASGQVRESMSFPNFKFIELINQDWETSTFAEKLERKFLFVLFQKESCGTVKFAGARFWNMPFEDRLEAKKVFEETKRRVLINPTNLPSSKESPVAHVRPKATNRMDTYPTPQGGTHTKQAFWLNNHYIKRVLRELFPLEMSN